MLGLELLGSSRGLGGLGAGVALVLVFWRWRGCCPPAPCGTRGLPAVVATRGLLSATFFCAEAYIVYVLQDRWGLTPGQAGIALTLVGLVWALSSQVQSRLGSRITHARAMQAGTAVVLAGAAALLVSVADRVGGAGLPRRSHLRLRPRGCRDGFAYPRTGVAMLAESTDRDRGFNSSALAVADALGAALALSVSGVAFAAAEEGGADPFLVVFASRGHRRTRCPVRRPDPPLTDAFPVARTCLAPGPEDL